ncbi:MAG TPA: L-threonylcarbamoyladenylate synthase [Candidatus Limnocylindria bacterium]|nr:L-threonylcarbamoyladenylate synthase [Candidatus Limnocylindria bacterium]
MDSKREAGREDTEAAGKTLLLPATQENVRKAAALLRAGGLVAFPTETVYGLGANALSEKAVEGIFRAKGRPADNPLIVHTASAQAAKDCGAWTPLADTLAAAFWPGPLTLIVRHTGMFPQAVTAGLDTVALRVPSHPAALALLAECEIPIAAPSANRSGRPSPTSALHVLEDFDGLIPMVLDGGDTAVGLESTVADARGGIPVVLRPGAVTPEMLAAVAGECRVAESVMREVGRDEAAPSPGMRHRHYAPRAKVRLVHGNRQAVAAHINALARATPGALVLAMEGNLGDYPGLAVWSLGLDARDAAHRLFGLLREADARGYSLILCETLPADGLGLAVMNRLARAAEFDITDAGQ